MKKMVCEDSDHGKGVENVRMVCGDTNRGQKKQPVNTQAVD